MISYDIIINQSVYNQCQSEMILICVTRIKVKLYYPDKCILLCFDIFDTELSSSPDFKRQNLWK